MRGATQPRGSTYAGDGFRAGCMAAVVFWFFPLPVALIVWLFQLKGLFADYMYMAIPFLILLPILGGIIGLLIVRSKEKHGDSSTGTASGTRNGT